MGTVTGVKLGTQPRAGSHVDTLAFRAGGNVTQAHDKTVLQFADRLKQVVPGFHQHAWLLVRCQLLKHPPEKLYLGIFLFLFLALS